MQGFSTSIRDRYQDKWVLSLKGEGPKQVNVEKPLENNSEKRSEKRRKRRKLSVVEKF